MSATKVIIVSEAANAMVSVCVCSQFALFLLLRYLNNIKSGLPTYIVIEIQVTLANINRNTNSEPQFLDWQCGTLTRCNTAVRCYVPMS